MIKVSELPDTVRRHLPGGLKDKDGFCWLVLPEQRANNYDGVVEVNTWIRAEAWYPHELQDVMWFGDARDGNFLGWNPHTQRACLWNPEDGPTPWKEGTVEELWQFVEGGYQ